MRDNERNANVEARSESLGGSRGVNDRWSPVRAFSIRLEKETRRITTLRWCR